MKRLLVTCLLATMPLVATAQSEATCVAYMEADAAWEAEYDSIHREYRETSKAAKERFWETFRSRKVSWPPASPSTTRIHKLNPRLRSSNGWTGKNGSDEWLWSYHQEGETVNLDESIGAAFRDLHDEYKTFVQPDYDTYKAENAAASDKFKTVRDKADHTRVSAYLDAYEGSRSRVSSVMARLLDADRGRCRVWYGG